MKKHGACIILLAALLSGCGLFNKDDERGPAPLFPDPEFIAGIEKYSSCNEMETHIEGLLEQQNQSEQAYRRWQEQGPTPIYYYGNSLASGETLTANDTPQTESDQNTNVSTNTQEIGVDEADFTKIGQHHILIARGRNIEVIDRSDLVYLGSFTVGDITAPNLFLSEDQLVVIGESSLICSAPFCESVETVAAFYDLEAGKLPVFKSKVEFAGSLVSSRMSEGALLIVSRTSLPIYGGSYYDYSQPQYLSYDEGSVLIDGPILPVSDTQQLAIRADGTVKGISCTDFVKKSIDDYDWTMTNIHLISLVDPQNSVRSLALLGGGEEVYISKNSIYLGKDKINWFSEGYVNSKDYGNLIVKKIDYNISAMTIEAKAVGIVKGKVISQWSFKELEDKNALAIATTSGQLGLLSNNGYLSNTANNHLFVLRQNSTSTTLDVIGKIDEFGINEDIRAVRYVGDIGYVVTFKKTDPLFAFDLSDPTNPSIIGELKIPGFSTYLHPVKSKKLIGLGFDADDYRDFALYAGVQISLFDVTDPLKMTRIDNHIHGQRGSSSEATANHHAFYYGVSEDIVGFPIVELETSGDFRTNNVGFSGAVLYQIRNDKLIKLGQVSHKDFLTTRCLDSIKLPQFWQHQTPSSDINRILKHDGKLYSISKFGVEQHEVNNPETVIASVRLSEADELCPQGMTVIWD